MNQGPLLATFPKDMVGRIAEYLSDKHAASLSASNKHLNQAVKNTKWKSKEKIKKYFPYLRYTHPLEYFENSEALYQRERERVAKQHYELLDDYVDRANQILGNDHCVDIIMAAMAGKFDTLAKNPDLNPAEILALQKIAVGNGHFGDNYNVLDLLDNAGKGAALKFAAQNGNAETAKQLLKTNRVNIDIGVRLQALRTASTNGHLDTVKVLVELGGGNARQNSKITGEIGSSLDIAAENGHLAVFKFLLPRAEENFKLHLQTYDYGRILSKVIKNGHLEMATFLISKGAPLYYWDHSHYVNLNSAYSALAKSNLSQRFLIGTVVGVIPLMVIKLINNDFILKSLSLLAIPAVWLFQYARRVFQANAYKEYVEKSKEQTDYLMPERRAAFKQGMLSAVSTIEHAKCWTPLRSAAIWHPKAWAAGFVAAQKDNKDLIFKVKYPKI